MTELLRLRVAVEAPQHTGLTAPLEEVEADVAEPRVACAGPSATTPLYLVSQWSTSERMLVRQNFPQIVAAARRHDVVRRPRATAGRTHLCFLLKLNVRHSGSSSMYPGQF